MSTVTKRLEKSQDLYNWLESIRKASGTKKLQACDVVEAARDEKSPAHNWFTWDNRKAANEYRLEQARDLIRTVYVIDTPSGLKTPAYVSLLPDRDLPGGGYRQTSEVLSSKQLTAQLELTAKAELRAWTERYRVLTKLVTSVARAAGLEKPVRKKTA